eukprot:7053522-Prymnesium_polylepis.1
MRSAAVPHRRTAPSSDRGNPQPLHLNPAQPLCETAHITASQRAEAPTSTPPPRLPPLSNSSDPRPLPGSSAARAKKRHLPRGGRRKELKPSC